VFLGSRSGPGLRKMRSYAAWTRVFSQAVAELALTMSPTIGEVRAER